jgi:hypothetical protein
MLRNEQKKNIHSYIASIVVVTLITVALDPFQREVLLCHIARLRFHMTLAILYVRERSIKGRTKLAPCLLKQPLICCLSLCCISKTVF